MPEQAAMIISIAWPAFATMKEHEGERGVDRRDGGDNDQEKMMTYERCYFLCLGYAPMTPRLQLVSPLAHSYRPRFFYKIILQKREFVE